MNYEELVKALRDIEKTMFALGTSPINMGDVSISLAYDKRWGQTAERAAAAIEALQAELEKKRTADCFGCKCDKLEPSGRLQKRGKPVLLAASSMNGCEKLPKRGEWIATKYYTWECSVCGKNPTTGMGYVQTRKALYNYCPNCGAKMEVQDGKRCD